MCEVNEKGRWNLSTRKGVKRRKHYLRSQEDVGVNVLWVNISRRRDDDFR